MISGSRPTVSATGLVFLPIRAYFQQFGRPGALSTSVSGLAPLFQSEVTATGPRLRFLGLVPLFQPPGLVFLPIRAYFQHFGRPSALSTSVSGLAPLFQSEVTATGPPFIISGSRSSASATGLGFSTESTRFSIVLATGPRLFRFTDRKLTLSTSCPPALS